MIWTVPTGRDGNVKRKDEREMPRELPITPQMLDVLERAKKKCILMGIDPSSRDAPVFPGQDGRPHGENPRISGRDRFSDQRQQDEIVPVRRPMAMDVRHSARHRSKDPARNAQAQTEGGMNSTRDPNNAHCAGPAVPATESCEPYGAWVWNLRPEGSGTRTMPNQTSAGNAAPIATRDHEFRASPGRVKGPCKPSTS
jgi:hypothetical protein